MAARRAATRWPPARPLGRVPGLSARPAWLARQGQLVTAPARQALRPVTAPAPATSVAARLAREGIASDSVMSRARMVEENPRSAVPTGSAVPARANAAAAARPAWALGAEVASVAAAAAAASGVAAVAVAAGVGNANQNYEAEE